MEKILIIANTPERFTDLAKSLTDDRTEVETVRYNELAFLIDGTETKIFCYPDGADLKDFEKILVLSTPNDLQQNHIFSAIACYCRKYNIEIMDDTFPYSNGKLFAMWKFWEDGVVVPKTAFGPVDFLIETLSKFGGIGVLKSIVGTKGRDNYLVKSGKEIREIITANPDVEFILQNFIPNDGDYRIILTNFVPKLAIYRSANGKDFRNNTSLGGEASLVPLENLDPEILELAVAATRSLNIKIAGADILQDKDTGTYSVLEVNRTPQLASGAFVEAKTAVLKELVNSSRD